ncbi:MAG TPA: ABC transporter permease [Candidatus Acidoferrum sp.]|nr:ABC transporter permease [Candidatus Acidoferrum sp.]
MFWRMIRRLIFANPGRLFVILLALGAGAAVTAALLNLQVDAKRRLTSEFRTFGPNVVIAPRGSGDRPGFLSASMFARVPGQDFAGNIAKAEFLYGIVGVSKEETGHDAQAAPVRAILAGYAHSDFGAKQIIPSALVDAEENRKSDRFTRCTLGGKVAIALGVNAGQGISLRNGTTSVEIAADVLPMSGGAEDNQIFVDLPIAQKLLDKPEQISLIQLSVPGTTQQVQKFVEQIQPDLGEAEARPLRQFTEAQAKIYGRISGILNFTVAIVLLLTALCVMAATTNIAMERRIDVGLMKAIGGAKRRVLRLFLAEAALLGLAGGLLGAAAGILLSIWLGKQVFGVAAEPRLIVYPVTVLLTVLVAILSAFPLRRLASVRPASVFRGEA